MSATGPTGTDGGRGLRRYAATGVRAGAIVAAGALLVAGAAVVDEPVALPGAAPQAVTDELGSGGSAVVTERTVACVGPEQQGLVEGAVEERPQPVAAAAMAPPADVLPAGLSLAPEGEVVLAGVPAGEQSTTSERADLLTAAVEGPRAVVLTGTGALAPAASGGQVHLGTAPERRGLTLAACTSPSTETWLVAGGDQPGRIERLVLVNPGASPVTVSATVLGVQGEPAQSGERGIVVGAGERTVMLLDALAPGAAAPVLRVTSTGGPVVAALGDRWLEGTLDRGLALTGPVAPPATSHVVPAIPLGGDDTALLRVGVPGTTEAVVQVRALTAEGPVRIDQDVRRVPAGATADLAVGGLPPGTHALQVTSDEDVVAAVQVRRGGQQDDAVADLTWVGATRPVADVAGLPLPAPATPAGGEDVDGQDGGGQNGGDGDPQDGEDADAPAGPPEVDHLLVLAAVEPAEVVVVTTGDDGTVHRQRLAVEAATSRVVELGAATSVWVRATGGAVHAAVLAQAQDAAGPYLGAAELPGSSLTRRIVAVTPWRP